MKQPYLWDNDGDDTQFQKFLDGKIALRLLGVDWEALRLRVYAPCPEIVLRDG